jgi:hypothetical protein
LEAWPVSCRTSRCYPPGPRAPPPRRRFPYAVIYRIVTNEVVEIVAVMHRQAKPRLLERTSLTQRRGPALDASTPRRYSVASRASAVRAPPHLVTNRSTLENL